VSGGTHAAWTLRNYGTDQLVRIVEAQASLVTITAVRTGRGMHYRVSVSWQRGPGTVAYTGPVLKDVLVQAAVAAEDHAWT